MTRDRAVIEAQQAVGDDDRGAGDLIAETVLQRGDHVVAGVLAAAGIEGVGVGEERAAAEPLDLIDDDADVLRPQVGQVSLLAEAGLDGDEVVLRRRSAQVQIFAAAAGTW